MSKKINFKALLVFLFGFFLVSISLLVSGFFLLPGFFSSQEIQVESVALEEKKSIEKPQKEEHSPNVTFISKATDGLSMEVRCGEGVKKGAEVALYLESQSSCSVQVLSGQRVLKTERTFEPLNTYFCFPPEGDACFSEEELTIKKADLLKASKKQKKVQKPKKENNSVNIASEEVIGPATLTISSDVQAKIFIDGKFIRNAPLIKHKVSSGKHRIIIAAADGKKKMFNLNAEDTITYMRAWSFNSNQWNKFSP